MKGIERKNDFLWLNIRKIYDSITVFELLICVVLFWRRKVFLGNIKINRAKKQMIAVDAASKLTKGDPDILATSCPLCKKTFSGVTETRVADISEIVAEALVIPESPKKFYRQITSVRESADIS